MTESESKALELVSELSTIDAAIADTRKKIGTLREKQTSLAVDTETAPAKLAGLIKKCADDLEVAESALEIVQQRKAPLLARVKPLIKSIQGEHWQREQAAKKSNIQQAEDYLQSDVVQQAMSTVATAARYYTHARGIAVVSWDDLFRDEEAIQKLYDALPAFTQVSEPDAKQQLQAWEHQADMAAQQDTTGQQIGVGFG